MIYVIISSSCSCHSFSQNFQSLKVVLAMDEVHLCPFSALLTPFPVLKFNNKKVPGCINEEVIGAHQWSCHACHHSPQEIHLPVCLFVCLFFTVLLGPSINRSDFSSDSSVLTLYRMGLFRATHEEEKETAQPLPPPPPRVTKICHKYPTIIKSGTVTPR